MSASKKKMTEQIDIEAFISEVKKFPEIWDINCEDFRYKKRKERAWNEVVRVFIPDFDDLAVSERNEIYRSFYGKWRNLRDSFVRHLRKGGESRNGYVYANHMSFLNDLYKPSDEETANYQEEPTKKRKRIKVKKLEEIWNTDDLPNMDDMSRKSNEIDFMETFPVANCSTSFQMDDEDRSFFESLLPAVREFTMDQKLQFRCEVISVIKNIRSKTKLELDPETGDFS